MTGLREYLIGLDPLFKRVLILCADLALIPVALWFALSLRYGDWFRDTERLAVALVMLMPFTILVFVRLELYRSVLRFGGQQLFERLAIGVLLSSPMLLLIARLVPGEPLPKSTFIIYGLVVLPLLAGTRMLAQMLLVFMEKSGARRVAIYGAGAAGRQLVAALQSEREFRVVSFIDDDPSLNGRRILGTEVINPSDSLAELLNERGVSEVFLSIPSATAAQKRSIMDRLRGLSLHIRTVPSLGEIISGAARLSQIREIEIEELLGREIVPPRVALLDRCIRGKSVLVTGAAGSIGSELCRQVLSQGARKLILLDHSEYGLYAIEAELRKAIANGQAGGTQLIALLGSITDSQRLESVFSAYNIDTVYHAAAYKHVPLVEFNPLEGIKANTFGTWNTAECALRHRVKHFVLISTDKAVRPTNVMGASKRVAEMILQALQAESDGTIFSMVRFGNVLGSSGSVVPLFRNQIREGGPITVTHPEITRFFMTIPEAVQLVIQAGAMAKGGEVFVLDMGEPVKIADLARQMIRLSGFEVRGPQHPEGLEIVFTGLRPGEKLYEELLIGADVSRTEHPKIMRAYEEGITRSELMTRLSDLKLMINEGDTVLVRRTLASMVQGYSPAEEIADHIWNRKNAVRANDAVETKLGADLPGGR